MTGPHHLTGISGQACWPVGLTWQNNYRHKLALRRSRSSQHDAVWPAIAASAVIGRSECSDRKTPT